MFMRALIAFSAWVSLTLCKDVLHARPITQAETAVLNHLEDLAIEVIAEKNLDTALPSDIRHVKVDIESEIRAVPVGSADPPELLATLWALTVWTNSPSKYSYENKLASSLAIRDLGKNSLKCNRFVADAFGIGACKGFATDGIGGAYPVGGSSWLFWNGFPPSANELANESLILANLYVIKPGDPIKAGYIIGFPYSGGVGHSGLYLGPKLYISAREDKYNQRPGRRIQVKDGVQITRIPEIHVNGSRVVKVYRRFAYGFNFNFSFTNKIISRRFYIPNSYFKVTLAAHYNSASPSTGATQSYVVSLHSVEDDDHSECLFTVGTTQYCQWRKPNRGVYYIEIYKIGSALTSDVLEGTGETTIP